MAVDQPKGPALLLPRERYPRKRLPHPCAVIVEVPLPGVVRAIVHERVMEPIGGRVIKEKRNRVARDPAASNPGRVERAGPSVVEPETGILARAGIAPEEHDRLVTRRAVRSPLAGHF